MMDEKPPAKNPNPSIGEASQKEITHAKHPRLLDL